MDPMKFAMNAEELARLLEALRRDEDCEESGDGSFTVDLYEPDPVVSLELYPEKNGYSITAAALMEYSEELEGWYMRDRIRDEEELRALDRRLRERFLGA